jgi:AraC-like DNA-binding protein
MSSLRQIFTPVKMRSPWFWISGVGCYHVGRSYGHDLPEGHVHGSILFLTVAGGGDFRWGSHRWHDEGNTFSIMPASRVASVWRTRQQAWNFYWLGLAGAGVEQWLKQFELRLLQCAVRFKLSLVRDLRGRFDDMLTATPEQASSLDFQAKGFSIFCSAMQAVADAGARKPMVQINNQDVLAVIDEYLRRPEPEGDQIVEIASRIGVSSEHLSRVFKSLMGISPKRYCLQQRTRQAQWLLQSTPLDIDEIARRVGYGDAAYFSRMFRREVGLMPSQYRRRSPVI